MTNKLFLRGLKKGLYLQGRMLTECYPKIFISIDRPSVLI